MGTITVTEKSLVEEAEKQLKLATRLHALAYDTGKAALDKAYRLAMLRYMERVVALESKQPEYVSSLRDTTVERMHFLERKLDSLMRLEKTPTWGDRLYTQFETTLKEYEVVYDQAVALGWEPPRPELPEAKYPCYKGDGLCRLAESQSLTACVYSPDSCRWMVKSQEKATNK
jgi:hypothetical protein